MKGKQQLPETAGSGSVSTACVQTVGSLGNRLDAPDAGEIAPFETPRSLGAAINLRVN
jgi:hypothetical protein